MTKPRDLSNLGGGFIQSGTGAVQRTVENKLKDTVSVKDFGAVGDGVADDFNAITAARDYCLSTSPYKQLYFPPGTYKITQKLTFAFPGLSVLGAGKRSSTIYFTGTGIAVEFTDANPNNGAFAFGSEIQNISIRGNANATTLLRIKFVNHFYAKNVNLFDASTTTGCGLQILGVVCGYWDNIICSTNHQVMASRPAVGIIVDRDPTTLARATDNTFINPVIEGMIGDGIQLVNSDQSFFLGGTSENNNGNGITINASSRMNTCISVAFENNSGTTFADIYDGGFSNRFINCYSKKQIYIDTSSQFSKVEGGFHQTIVAAGDFATIQDLRYSFFAAGGTITPSSTTSTRNLFNANTSAITFATKNTVVVTPTASPYTYTNGSGLTESVIVSGGTVSQIVFDRGGPITTLPTAGMFTLQPQDKLVISYSVVPTVVRVPYGTGFI